MWVHSKYVCPSGVASQTMQFVREWEHVPVTTSIEGGSLAPTDNRAPTCGQRLA